MNKEKWWKKSPAAAVGALCGQKAQDEAEEQFRAAMRLAGEAEYQRGYEDGKRAAQREQGKVKEAYWEHIIEQKPVFDKLRGEYIIETPKTRCSNCKKTNKDYTPPYCPHCGAIMHECMPPQRG